MASIVNATATYLSTGNGYVNIYGGNRNYLPFEVSQDGNTWNTPDYYLSNYESYFIDNGDGTATVKGTFTTNNGIACEHVAVVLPINVTPTSWITFNTDNNQFSSGLYGPSTGSAGEGKYIISISGGTIYSQNYPTEVVNFNFVIGISHTNTILP